jgi:hypothetical protein
MCGVREPCSGLYTGMVLPGTWVNSGGDNQIEWRDICLNMCCF